MNTEFKDEVTVQEMMPVTHTEFAKYTIREFLPSYIDGLKLVYRRLLWTLGTNAARQKCINLIADTMGKLHVHGDQSVYSGLIRLAQKFSQCLPFIDSPGNTGSYGGARAAASRYLDINRSEFACDLFFNKVNTKTFSYVENELNNGVEPAYFIPIVPTVFIMGVTSIGVGFKSVIPFYNFTNICDLTIKYVKMRKEIGFHPEQHYPEFTKYMIPDFPTYSLIRNGDDLIAKYNKGDFNAPIITDGCMDVFPGKIILKSIPYGNPFQQVLDKLKTEMTKHSFISAHVNEVANLMSSVDVGDIKISLKRGVDVFDILEEMKRQLGFTRSFNPIWNFSDNEGTVYNLTPFQLLEKWYVERYRSILGDLKITQRELNVQKREIEAKVIIVDHTDEVTNIVKTSSCKQEAVERLVSRFREQRLSPLQAEYILTLSLAQLTREGKDKLLADLEQVVRKIKEHTEKFQDVDAIVIQSIEEVRNKYASRIIRRCALPDYIGCIHINGNGVVQVRSLQELAHQVRRWGNENITIEMYPEGKSYHVSYLNGKGSLEEPMCFPKAFKANDLKTTKLKPRSTVCLNDGLIYRVDAMVKAAKGQSVPVAEFFSAVDKKNIMTIFAAKDVVKRLQVNSMGVQTDIKFISPVADDKLAVVYHDVKTPNEMHVAVVKHGDKLPASLLSKIEVTHIFRMQDQMAVTVDDKYLNRCSVKHLYFKSAEALLNGEAHIVVYLNKRTTSNKQNLVQIIKGIDLYGTQHLTKVKNDYEFI